MTAQERYEYVRSQAQRIGSCISTFARNAASKVIGFASDDNYTGGNVTTPKVVPHCDERVLHAPGECNYCDCYPDAQALREQWCVNFTGHDDPAKSPCPAEAARGRTHLNAWGGNVAHQSGDANFALAQLAASEMSPEEIDEAIASLREMKADLAASAPEVFLEEDPRYRAK